MPVGDERALPRPHRLHQLETRIRPVAVDPDQPPAGIENHRRHAQINAFEHLLQLCGQYTGLPHPDQQCADALGEPGEHRGVDLLRRHPDLEVGEPRYMVGNFIDGITGMEMKRGARAV